MTAYLYYIGLGSNLGEREQYLVRAVERLQEVAGEVVEQSSYYYSEPWGYESENGFCNQCIALRSTLAPLELLHLTQEIERELGRTVKSGGVGDYHDRTIDIDLLTGKTLMGEDVVMDTKELTLPHPLMQQRDFVMIPLGELQR